MAIERKIKAKVFLEGQEIPFFNVTVQNQIGQSAVAQIEIPPADSFFELTKSDPNTGGFIEQRGVLPRTMVHVFYLDPASEGEVYRLLFEGEFLGYDYQKTPTGRSIRLMAMDLSNVFNIVYTRYYADFFLPYNKFVASFAGVNKEGFRQNVELLGTDAIVGEILRIIREEEVAGQGRGVAAALKRIVANSAEKNDFFRLNNLRTKLVNKIFALDDPNSVDLIKGETLKSMIFQTMSNLKEHNHLWDILNHIMGIIFYYPLVVSASPYIKGPATTTTQFGSGAQTNEVSTDLLFDPVSGQTSSSSLMSMLFKPYTFFSAPPRCNVIFPDQYFSFTSTRRFNQEPTRLLMSAFSIIEEAIKPAARFLPKQFFFVAPTALASKFDQEREFTQVAEGSVAQQMSEVLDKKREIEDLEKRQQQNVSSSDTTASLSLQQEIDTAKEELAALEESTQAAKDALDQQAQSRARTSSVTGREPSSKSEIGASLFGKNILTQFDGVTDVSREDIKGPIAKFDHLTNTQATVAKSSNVNLPEVQGYLSDLANFRLYLAQHQSRQSTVSMIFSPQLVPGFPALIVDPVENIFGELDVVIHRLDAEGNASTQSQISLVRSDDPKFSEVERSTVGNIQFPNWINSKYLPQFIGDNVYSVLFPRNGDIPALQSILIESGETNQQFVAARNIRERYNKQSDKGRFIYGFTRRNVATIDQTFEVLGAPKVNESQYAVAGTTSDRLAEVLKYREQVSKGVFSFTSDFVSNNG